MTRHPQTREMWDLKGAEHKSEGRDAETQDTSDEGQIAPGSAASSPLRHQCGHQETVVGEMVFVLPSFLNLVILSSRGNS